MKVLHVYRTYHPDQPSGIAEAIRQTCLATGPHAVQSTIFTLSPRPHAHSPKREEAYVVREKSCCAPASCDLGGPRALRTFRQVARPADIIHYHFPWPFADLLHLAAGSPAPAVMTWHSDIVRQGVLLRIYAPLMNAMLRRMVLVAATSRAYADSSPVLARRKIRDRVRVLPLGIVEASLPPTTDTGWLERLGLNEPFILFLGALRYYKGLDTLLEAASDRVTLVLAGGGPDLERLRLRTTHARRVVFTGPVSESAKMSLLRACRALVLPSHLRSEAYGMVLVEAAMCGKPMITCEIGTGTSFVNLDGETGLVVNPDDPAALRRALDQLTNDAALAARLGSAARRRYEACFSGPVFGQACMDFYHEAINATSPVSTGTAEVFRRKLSKS